MPSARTASRLSFPLVTVLVLAGSPGSVERASAAQQASDEPSDFFTREVRPVLETHCVSCHGAAGKVKGGLDLSTRDGLLKGGALGPAVDLEEPAASVLLDAVNHAGPEMPPKSKLPDEQIEILSRWVSMGAPWDREGRALEPPAARDLTITEDHRRHWSFQPVRRPPVPDLERPQEARNPIDAFVLDRLRRAGIAPVPEADRVALLRRLSQDLTGLPPTPEAIDSFLADQSPDAYERRVDELMASPRYGERWGRHWLDLVRFAETNSFERDKDKPFSWRYRDYVILSLNEDKPFDQFAREQLAGDELDRVTAETITATGFYRLGAWDDEPTDGKQAVFDEFDDIVTTMSQSFLGLTVNCARCHEHKIDPIPQRDYYRLLAFLRNLKPFSYDESHVLTEIATPAERQEHARLDAERSRVEAELLDALRPYEERLLAEVPEPRRSSLREEKRFERRKHVYDDLVAKVLDPEARAAYQALVARWENRPVPPPLPRALSARETGPNAPETFVLIRGAAASPGAKVEPGFPEVLGFDDPVLPTSDPGAASSGRRRVLADWIASPRNPLTARVIVNRVWQHHFGRGLSRTPNDFGLQGSAPSHPELLDWLASELVAGGWKLKPLHRLIVTSATYRRSSRGEEGARAADPENDLFWRFNPRRLSAEEVRDGILAVTGELREEMGGPGFYPAVAPAYMAGQSRPGDGWGVSSPGQQARRSVYIHLKRSLVTPILASFDVADTDSTCPVRFATTQPTQALSTLNGPFLNERARAMAERLEREAGDPAARVARGLRLVTGRTPTASEVARGLAFLDELATAEGAGPERALRFYCLLLLNLNEFMYVD